MKEIRNNLSEAKKLIEDYLSDDKNLQLIEDAGNKLVEILSAGKKVISCGNGGSMCDAMHFAQELTGLFREKRKSIPAIAISDPSFITCAGNDLGYEWIFSRFIEGVGEKGDVLLILSTSGNSPNIINAAKTAKEMGIFVLAMTGKDGGKLKETADLEIRIPWFGYPDRIQEMHIKIIHSLIHHIEMNLL